MIVSTSVKELIRMGNLVQPFTYTSNDVPDVSKVQVSNGDYNSVALEKLVNRPALIGNAVKHYQEICPGVPAVAFCISVQHAKDTAAAFKKAGYLFEHIDGEMTDKERRAILKRLESGEIHGITSVDLVTEGFDCPAPAMRDTHAPH